MSRIWRIRLTVVKNLTLCESMASGEIWAEHLGAVGRRWSAIRCITPQVGHKTLHWRIRHRSRDRRVCGGSADVVCEGSIII